MSWKGLAFVREKGEFILDYPYFNAQGGILKLLTDKFILLSSECRWEKKENVFRSNFSFGKTKGTWDIKIENGNFSSSVKNLSSSRWTIKCLSLSFAYVGLQH